MSQLLVAVKKLGAYNSVVANFEKGRAMMLEFPFPFVVHSFNWHCKNRSFVLTAVWLPCMFAEKLKRQWL